MLSWPSPSWPVQVAPGCLTLPKILLQRQMPNKMINYQQTEQNQKPWTHGTLYFPCPTMPSFLQTSLRVMKTWLSNLPVRSKDGDWYLSNTYRFSHMIETFPKILLIYSFRSSYPAIQLFCLYFLFSPVPFMTFRNKIQFIWLLHRQNLKPALICSLPAL